MTGTIQIPIDSHPAQCPLCAETFRYRLTLRRHMQKFHKSERHNEDFEEWFRGLKLSQRRRF